MKLDKFYTKPIIAKECINFLQNYLPEKPYTFLEPSAGSGAFLPFLGDNYIALDIAPEGSHIQRQDFFLYTPQKKQLITIGNPPFGKRCSTAIQFFNHAAEFSEIIAFILPVSFMKWNVQKQLDKDWHLYDYFYLPPRSFTTNGKDYSIRCVFQIWGKQDIGKDSRLLKAPPISHPDFELWQYNATPEAFSVIDKPWKYALYRQGYKDYTRIFTQEDYQEIKQMMEQNIQFFFMLPKIAAAEKFIFSVNFTSLAERNMATPGFGKADFISYYLEWQDKQNKLKEESQSL